MNERDDKYDSHDEGEYHFSDEHATYEMDTETAKVADVAVAKSSPLANLSKSRRALIALGVFFTLMFIIYKMLMPASTTQPITTDVATNKPKVNLQTPRVAQIPNPTPLQPATPTQTQATPDSQLLNSTVVTGSSNLAPAGVLPPGTMPENATQADNSQLPDNTGAPQDRLSTVEQQSAKLANEVHIEYQQKIADFETQSTATQAKLQELTTRVASIETALTQITQLLQNSNNRQALTPPPAAPRASRAAEPKQIYTVQAIIPGRAWLKSDVGDTVTVAEGDILRDYGRVTKIDPYDGVVDIDTGNKVVSLSYGAGGD